MECVSWPELWRGKVSPDNLQCKSTFYEGLKYIMVLPAWSGNPQIYKLTKIMLGYVEKTLGNVP